MVEGMFNNQWAQNMSSEDKFLVLQKESKLIGAFQHVFFIEGFFVYFICICIYEFCFNLTKYIV